MSLSPLTFATVKTSSSNSRILFGLLTSFLLLASACGATRGDDVAAASLTFDDDDTREVSSEDYNAVLDSINASERFVESAFSGEIPFGFEASVLSGMIVERAIDQLLVEEGLEVPEGEVEDRLDGLLVDVNTLMGDEEIGGEVFEELAPYLDSLANLQAKQGVLVDKLTEGEEIPQIPCASHILVAELAESEDLLDQLNNGGDFAALATELSLDPGSGELGGSLGCSDPALYVDEFRIAIEGGVEGELMGPIETQYGYHIIVIDGYEDGESNGLTLLSDAITALLGSTTVVVDPVIGTWDELSSSVTATPVEATEEELDLIDDAEVDTDTEADAETDAETDTEE